jgi:hypothetical protein
VHTAHEATKGNPKGKKIIINNKCMKTIIRIMAMKKQQTAATTGTTEERKTEYRHSR